MKRSAGVTVIAVLSLIGSAFTLLMGILMVVVMAIVPDSSTKDIPASPVFLKVLMIMGALVYVAPAIWGIFTSIGLFRLRNWARLSIIVFSVLLICMFGFGGLLSLVMPFPSTPGTAVDSSVVTGVRLFMGLFSGALVGVGIWWIVFFTRQRVVQQFVPPLPPPDPMQALPLTGVVTPRPSRRPLSITILAWFILAGCFFMPLGLLLHSPAMMFTRLVTGWPATVFYLTLAVIAFYVGIGLLRLKPAARIVGIAYFVFSFVNASVFYLAPGARERINSLMAASQSMFPGMPTLQDQPNFGFDPTKLMVVSMCFGLVILMVPLFILVRQKPAFEKAAAKTADINPTGVC